MSAIFNGTSAYFLTANAVVGATPNYPVLMGAWFKLTDVNAAYAGCVLTDNAALPAVDYARFYLDGSTAGDPVKCDVAASGAFATSADIPGLTAGVWIWVGCILRTSADRSSILGTTVGTPQTTATAVTGLTTSAFGSDYYGSGTTGNFLKGNAAEVIFASGNASITTNITAILAAITTGTKPTNIAALSPYLNVYQPLKYGLNDTGYIGATWTANNITYDSTVQPTLIRGGSPSRMNIGLGIGV